MKFFWWKSISSLQSYSQFRKKLFNHIQTANVNGLWLHYLMYFIQWHQMKWIGNKKLNDFFLHFYGHWISKWSFEFRFYPFITSQFRHSFVRYLKNWNVIPFCHSFWLANMKWAESGANDQILFASFIRLHWTVQLLVAHIL